MMYTLVLLCVLTFYPGVSSADNSTTCNVPDLFNDFRDKFDQKNSTLKMVRGEFYKCLAMYTESPELRVNEVNIEATSIKIRGLTHEIVYQLMDTNSLEHSDHLPEFRNTCFYEKHLKAFGDAISEFTSDWGPQYELKLTCPMGLLWDIICTFESCLNSACDVDGEVCTETTENQSSCPKLNLKLYCRDAFKSFINSCVDDTRFPKHKKLIDESLNVSFTNDDGCSNFNLIYQGLTSLHAVEKSVIAVNCHESDKDNVVLKCFKNGKYLQRALWYLNDTKDPGGSRGTLNISRKDLQRYSNFACYDGTQKLDKIGLEHIYQLCFSVSDEEENRRSNDDQSPTKKPHKGGDQSTTMSTMAPTSQSSVPDERRSKWQKLYEDEKIWLFDKDYGSFEGIDALDNKARLQANVDKLSVATVSVMGRLTPICGEMWNEVAAKVFCRDAGAQLQQKWIPTHVGSLHKSRNERHQEGYFYKHYLRNITCKGTESNIIWCDHDGWYHHSGCTHDAVVICKEDKDEEQERTKGTDGGFGIILGIIIGLILLCILFACIYVYCRKHPEKYETLMRKLNGCYHRLDVATGGREGVASRRDTETTETGLVGHEMPHFDLDPSYGSELWSDEIEGSISRPRLDDEPSNHNHHSPVPIQEHHLQRLNSKNAPQWVLLYKMEEEEYVCKSFTNVQEDKDDMKTERFFLYHADHPNIVKLRELQNSKEIMFDNERKLYFFMERLEFGGLDSYLRSKDGNGFNHGHLMTVEDATNVIVGVCRALNYVHTLGYVHADICSDNFFAFRNCSNGLLDVKLGDFETFRRPPVTDWKNIRCTARCTAPEILLDDPKDEYGEKILKDAFKNDIWGLALVLWEVQSWIMCKNNKFAYKSEERSAAPMQSSIMMSLSRFMRSRFEHSYDYTCRSQVHIALFQKINNVNPRRVSASPEKPDKPDIVLMKQFYDKIHPHSMGYPPMDPKLDSKFGWPITNLLKKCLRINSNSRSSMTEVTEYLLKSATENPESPLAKYEKVLKKDLDEEYLPYTDFESDVDPIDLDNSTDPNEMFPPPTLQPNLGQLYSYNTQVEHAV